jgi:hypothetical protein
MDRMSAAIVDIFPSSGWGWRVTRRPRNKTRSNPKRTNEFLTTDDALRRSISRSTIGFHVSFGDIGVTIELRFSGRLTNEI